MKKFVLLSFFLSTFILFPFFLFSQTQWQENGVPVRQGDNIDFEQTAVSIADETVVTIWTDTRNGVRGLYAQKTDINGNSLWQEGGIQIYNPNRTQLQAVAVASDNNSVIVCWLDIIDINYFESNIRAQKIDAAGNLLWSDQGIFVANNGSGAPVQIVSHSDGGVFVIWDNGYQSNIKGKRLQPDGYPAVGWGNSIDILPTASRFSVSTDSMDGIVIAAVISDDIYGQRIDAAGMKLWGYYGTLVYNGIEWISRIDICANVMEDYYISWAHDVWNGIDHLLMQKTDADGNNMWDDAVNLAELDYMFNFSMLIPDDMQPVIWWTNDDFLFAQKVDSDGGFLWGDTGIQICTASPSLNRYSIQAITDNESNLIINWSDYSYNFYNVNILAQKINSIGQQEWQAGGVLICEDASNTSIAAINKLGQKFRFCWFQNINDRSVLFQQIIDDNANIYLEPNGEEMYSGLIGFAWGLKILPNGDNPVILWNDSRFNYDHQIYLQILNNDGTPQLAENGIPITEFSDCDQLKSEAIIGNNSNTIAVVWTENHYSNCYIYAQGLDTNGNYLWSNSTGILLSTQSNFSTSPQISVVNNAGNDEFYIGFQYPTDTWDYYIVGQKIIDGELQWGEEGIPISSINSAEIVDVVGKYYIWTEGGLPYSSLCIKLIEEDGNTAPGWPEYGLVITEEIPYDTDILVKETPLGLFLIWYIHEGQDDQIFGQIVDQDGNILWQENGIQLVDSDIYNIFNAVYNDGLYLIWNKVDDDYKINYFIQKFNELGETQWQEGGIQITDLDFNYFYPPVLTALGNDILFVYEQKHESTSSDLQAQIINPNGEMQYNLTGLTICNGYMDQKQSQIYVDEEDVYFCWIDGRSTIIDEVGLQSVWGVYSQKYHFQPTSVNNQLPMTNFQLSNFPNPFNPSGAGRSPSTTISFNLTAENAKDAKIEIFNIKGQKIKTFTNDQLSSSPINQIVWDGKDENNNPVSSGVYFYRLKAGNFEKSNKMVLLK